MKNQHLNTLNPNYKERDKILFGTTDVNYWGGSKQFTELSLEDLEKLVDLEFIDVEECTSYSPTVEEILEFMSEYPNFKAHGYAIAYERDDYRVTLEGVSHYGTYLTRDEELAFIYMFRTADDFELESGYAWFD
jgi:hypothetical protein